MKTDPLMLWIWRLHQLPNGVKDHPELGIVALLQVSQFSGKVRMIAMFT